VLEALGRAARAALGRVTPLMLLGVGFGLFLVYAFPGYMSSDSVQQLYEARTGVLPDSHPPIMAAIWEILDSIIAGPLLMLLLQGTFFLGGLFAVLRHVMSPRGAAVAASLLLLYPPVLTTMAVIWKDSQMAAFLAAGTGALLSEHRRIRVLGLALISLACAFRYNAFGAGMPIVFFLFVWQAAPPRWWKRYAIATAAAVAVVIVAFGTNKLLTDEKRPMSFSIPDIVGILKYTHPRSDEELRVILRNTTLRDPNNIQTQARRLYSPRNAYHLTWGEQRMFDVPETPQARAELDRAWGELVRDDPKAYLAHRWAVFKELLGLTENPIWSPIFNGFIENPDHPEYVNHNAVPSLLQVKMWVEIVEWKDDTWIYRVYVYAILALALLALLARDRVSIGLLVSGLLYELSFLPTTATPDYRYSHWMVTATCLTTVWLFFRRLRGTR
jgi:hypothetical protein